LRYLYKRTNLEILQVLLFLFNEYYPKIYMFFKSYASLRIKKLRPEKLLILLIA